MNRVDIFFFQTRRQQRKLNFLITQTELYAHFMGKKISGSGDQDTAAASAILHGLDKEETVPEFEQRLEPLEGQDETEGLGMAVLFSLFSSLLFTLN
jgi:DNA-binding domain